MGELGLAWEVGGVGVWVGGWVGGWGWGWVGGGHTLYIVLKHLTNHRFTSKTVAYKRWGAVKQCLFREMATHTFFVFSIT